MISRSHFAVPCPPIVRASLGFALASACVGALPCAVAHAQDPAAETASAPNAEVVRIHVVFMAAVETSEIGKFETEFHERQFPQFASEHGLLEVGSNGEPELTLRLQIVQPDKAENIYMIHSTAIYHDKVNIESNRACLQCSPAQAVADALSNVESAAAAVVENRATYEPEPEEVPTPDPAPPADAPRVRTLGPASYVGISASALGLGAVIAGAVLFDRGKVLENDPGAYILEYTDYRPAGAALLGVGIGAVVVGSVLIGVDLGVLLPRRRERARARVDGISAMTERPGIVVTGRF